MTTVNVRRPSPLQRRVLIVLAALDAKRPGPVATRDIERVLEQSADAPVYGPNLRASCRRMEDAGWLRTLRAPNLQLAVELTNAGRDMAAPLLAAELDLLREAEKRHTVIALPHRAEPAELAHIFLEIDGERYEASAARLVIPFEGKPYLLLLRGEAEPLRLRGDAVTTGLRYQACFDAGLPVSVQINDSTLYANNKCIND